MIILVINRKCKTIRLNINGQQLLPYANPVKYLGTALEANENGESEDLLTITYLLL